MGKLLGLFQVFLGELGDGMETLGGDADLLGGGGYGAGEFFEGALAVVERDVLFACVVGEEGDGGEYGAEGHAGDAGDQRSSAPGIEAAGGDQGGGAQEGGVADKKGPFREAGCVGRQHAHRLLRTGEFVRSRPLRLKGKGGVRSLTRARGVPVCLPAGDADG